MAQVVMTEHEGLPVLCIKISSVKEMNDLTEEIGWTSHRVTHPIYLCLRSWVQNLPNKTMVFSNERDT